MWRRWWQWVRGLFLRKKGAIEPHPRVDTDQGEREHVERLMEADSRHAGYKP